MTGNQFIADATDALLTRSTRSWTQGANSCAPVAVGERA